MDVLLHFVVGTANASRIHGLPRDRKSYPHIRKDSSDGKRTEQGCTGNNTGVVLKGANWSLLTDIH